jgi:hypothetical protein
MEEESILKYDELQQTTSEIIASGDLENLIRIWSNSKNYGTSGEKLRTYIEQNLDDVAKMHKLHKVRTFRELVEQYDWPKLEALAENDFPAFMEKIKKKYFAELFVANHRDHYYYLNEQLFADADADDFGSLVYVLCEKCEHTNLLAYVVFSLFKYIEDEEDHEDSIFNYKIMTKAVRLCSENNNMRVLKFLLVNTTNNQISEEDIITESLQHIDVTWISETLIDLLLDVQIPYTKIASLENATMVAFSDLMKEELEKVAVFTRMLLLKASYNQLENILVKFPEDYGSSELLMYLLFSRRIKKGLLLLNMEDKKLISIRDRYKNGTLKITGILYDDNVYLALFGEDEVYQFLHS